MTGRGADRAPRPASPVDAICTHERPVKEAAPTRVRHHEDHPARPVLARPASRVASTTPTRTPRRPTPVKNGALSRVCRRMDHPARPVIKAVSSRGPPHSIVPQPP